jgi:hypothetical protein
MKKVKKKTCHYGPFLCGQTTSSMRPYGRSGQIIWIGYKYLMLCKEVFHLKIVIICINF